jgi:uncharacterized membrane protein HdeD (DUF308 family)
MSAWDWIRIVGGVLGLYETYRQREKNPQKKVWILWLLISIGFILAGAFRI